ncbi:MAG: AraC family transcriptional regulator [Clostridia bacterium]|nr:AraC family transcriptional regulator [Clostridia bacterium]
MPPSLNSTSGAFEDNLFIVNLGEEKCLPDHAYGPAKRAHFLIHFVLSGCGKLQCAEGEFDVGPGQGFLILPEEITCYQADSDTPWHYAWVGYRGKLAEYLTSATGLDATHRVFTVPDPLLIWQILQDMRSDARALRLNQLAAAGGLMRFIAQIAPQTDPESAVSPAKSYCDKALWYLEGNYERAVSIQETADFVGLSRSHLYRLMVAECGRTPKEALLHIRMRHARRLLRETSHSLEEISRLIGLQTGAQFGVAFRQMYGITPGQYRKGNASAAQFSGHIPT